MYPFRVYNGSNSRFHAWKLRNGYDHLTFWQIGSDGGLLNAPVALTSLLSGPGERADLLVDFGGLPPGAVVCLTNNARTPSPTAHCPRPRAASRCRW
jgi:FtsP/CotA-like multicopper oxidase with cupredoxin domain